MKTRGYRVTSPRRCDLGRQWWAQVEVAGQVYHVGIQRGRRVRIPFKPRGPGAYGWQWWGVVRDANAFTKFYGRVPGSLGIRGLLLRAGLLPAPQDVVAQVDGSGRAATFAVT